MRNYFEKIISVKQAILNFYKCRIFLFKRLLMTFAITLLVAALLSIASSHILIAIYLLIVSTGFIILTLNILAKVVSTHGSISGKESMRGKNPFSDWSVWIVLGTLISPVLSLFLNGCKQEEETSPLKTEQNKPNILLIVIDDLGWKDLGCYGNTFYETPNIDRIATQGVLFTRAYSACAVCTPTRGSIMTGRSPARIGLTGHINPTGSHRYPPEGAIIPPDDFFYLPTDEVTIAEDLKPLGYHSLFVGKWHLGHDRDYWPENQGFGTGIGIMPGGSPDAPLHHYTYFCPFFDKERSPNFHIPGIDTCLSGEYLTDRLTQETVKWLKSYDPKRPFFVYLAHYAVHLPLDAPESIVKKYENKLKTTTDESQKNAVYAAMIESVDSSVGRILATLDKLDLADETIIIFTSDNGGAIYDEQRQYSVTNNEPLRSGKGFLYEGGIRVPLIIRWPGKTKEGIKTSVLSISHDIHPTILDMVGVQARGREFDGISLVPALTGKGDINRKQLHWYYPHYSPQAKRPQAAIRYGNMKLIENYDPPSFELYDLGRDLGEQKDLSKKMPEKVKELKRKLDEWLQSVNAKMHRPNPNYRKE